MRAVRFLLGCLVASLVAAPVLGAQAATADSARRDLIIVNPFSVLLLGFSGEYEHVITPSVTVSVGASVYPRDELDFSTATAKLRLYPQERAPSGFSVAGGVGLVRQERGSACFSDFCDQTGTVTSPSVGVSVDYTWLLGPSQHFVVGVGLGAQRVIGTSDADKATQIFPMGRFGIGYAF